jgi:hypothetical protein
MVLPPEERNEPPARIEPSQAVNSLHRNSVDVVYAKYNRKQLDRTVVRAAIMRSLALAVSQLGRRKSGFSPTQSGKSDFF